MTHRHNAIMHTWKYRVLHGVVQYTFIIFGLFAKPNLCPLTQNSGDATDYHILVKSGTQFRSGNYKIPVKAGTLPVPFHRLSYSGKIRNETQSFRSAVPEIITTLRYVCIDYKNISKSVICDFTVITNTISTFFRIIFYYHAGLIWYFRLHLVPAMNMLQVVSLFHERRC